MGRTSVLGGRRHRGTDRRFAAITTTGTVTAAVVVATVVAAAVIGTLLAALAVAERPPAAPTITPFAAIATVLVALAAILRRLTAVKRLVVAIAVHIGLRVVGAVSGLLLTAALLRTRWLAAILHRLTPP